MFLASSARAIESLLIGGGIDASRAVDSITGVATPS
jgi:hypothetical protein